MEKPRPALNTNDKESKSRNRKMFGVLQGTLQQFRTQIDKKADALTKRQELEQKIDQKVTQEREGYVEQQKRDKEKQLALREQLKKQQEQKELELLVRYNP